MPCLFQVAGVCNRDRATTVACHSNWGEHGKAGARRADDCYSVWGCSACHAWLDQGGSSAEVKRPIFDAALLRQIEDATSRQAMSQTSAAAVLLAGDLQMCLPLAIEVAPFYRVGQDNMARELESVLKSAMFPLLGPQVEQAYLALRAAYVSLAPDLNATALAAWCDSVGGVLAASLAQAGYTLQYRIDVMNEPPLQEKDGYPLP